MSLVWPFPRIPSGHNPFPWPSPERVVLRAANQNLTIASGNCTIMYRWHGAAVTGGLYVFKRIPFLPQFVNPSVKNQRFLPAPFTQGSRGAPAPVHFSMVPVKTGDVSSGSSSCLPRSGKLRERIVTRESLEGATPATASTSRAKPPEEKSLRGLTFSLSESP